MTEPTDPFDADTIPARRRRTGGDPATEPVDGSTVIARRESRRRAGRDRRPGHPPSPVAAASAGRVASTPDPASRVVYEPRPADPVVATRGTPAAHVPQAAVDGAAGSAADRRSARRTALIVVLAGSVVSVGAAVSLLVLVWGS